MPTKNEIAATMTRSQASQHGVVDHTGAREAITSNSRKMFGFTRKMLPPGLPTEPKLYVYSVSVYGEIVNLGPGFPIFYVESCPAGEDYGEPTIIDPLYFMEEAKTDVTEFTPHTGQQIADAIMKVGPGMNASWDRRKQGWFVSTHCPPTNEEVDRAVSIYTAECKRLLEIANSYASRNLLNEINEEHRRAASYLKQKVDWDKPLNKMVDCPGCQEPVRAGAIMHATPYCGYVFNWEQAISTGMKQIEDAPALIQAKLKKGLTKDSD